MVVKEKDFAAVRTQLDDQGNFADVRNSPWYRDAVYDRFSEAEYARRWAAARKKMAGLGVDCLIAGGGPNHWSYGSGMLWLTGHWEWHGMAVYAILPIEGEPTLLYGMGGTHAEAVRRSVAVQDVRPAHGGSFMKVAVERIKELGLEKGTIGLSMISPPHGDYMPVNQYNDLREGLPQARIELLGDFFHDLVVVKSPEEQARVARAGALVSRAVEAIAERAAPGVTDYQLAAAAAHTILDGDGMLDFLIIGSTPMSDPRMVFGSPRPSGRKLQKGDLIMMELAAGYYGYTAQLGTPICLGQPTPAVRHFFDDIILPGFLRMEDTLKPGRSLKETVEAGQFFREKGHQSRPGHLHCIDFTSAAPHVGVRGYSGAERWEPGMTVMLEPNPITPDGSLGIFFGHTYTITQDGHTRVTPYPLEITVI